MKTFLKLLAALVLLPILAAVAYLLFKPVPIAPVSWPQPAASGLTGAYAPNTQLANLQIIKLHGEVGPEHIVFGPDGKLYTGMDSGNIVRMNADGSGQEAFAYTDGRPLGLAFDAKGELIVADGHRGLLSIAPDGKVSVLTDQVQGDPIRFADAVVVAKNGKMYFSDASARFAPKDWGGTFEASILDLMEGSATGRVLEYDPATKATRTVAHGLSFANGVALSEDENTLLVNETGRFRVWKIAVTAKELDIKTVDTTSAVPANAQASVLLDNLPGYPDNLMRGQDGKIWLGLAAIRNPDVDQLANKPWVRKIIMRLPRKFWPVPKPYGHVLAFTEDGKVVADLQDPSGAYPETTAVTETKDRLYIQSLHANKLGWLAK